MIAAIAGVVAGLGVALAGCDDGGPRLDTVTPSAAPRGARVTITGHRLCGAQGDCARAAGEVQLGLEPPVVRASVVSYADTTAEIAIPSVAMVGHTSLVVVVNERSSNALDFEVLP